MPSAIDPRPRSLLWLAGGITLVVALHALHQPVWVSLGFLALAAWRVSNVCYGIPLPHRQHRGLWMLKHVLALVAFAAIYRTHGAVIGRDAGIGLFVLLLGLKLVEIRSQREFMLTAFLGFFLLVTGFFYSQSLPVALYAGICVLVLLGSLISLAAQSASLTSAEHFRIAGGLLLHAAAPMLVAFVLFPRPASPLWQLPKDARAGVSGLSEEMAPGQLSDLTLSDAVAFRAAFSTNSPPAAEMYWRGPVLLNTDGRKWTPGPSSARTAPAMTAQGARYSYNITMEPSSRPWLFALEHPSALPRHARLSRDLRVLVEGPVNERIRYSAESYTHVSVTDADWEELRAALQLPDGAHPRAKALGRKWRSELRVDHTIVQAALRMFREQPFFYTIAPPEISGDSVDGFLFDTRSGFCEHYASAFAVLMRAAKIPARVVTGYQGGEYNPVGDYYIVRQRDAHAWTEVWLGRRGWVRIDPTAAVSPARVQRGIDQAVSARAFGDAEDGSQRSGVGALWSRMRYAYDAVNNRWNIWVISYNARRQAALMGELGMDFSRRTLALALICGLFIAFVSVATFALHAVRRPTDPVHRAYATYCRKLARRGHRRQPHEGPLDFAKRVSGQLPRLTDQISRITTLYVQLRYAPVAPPDGVKHLARAVRAFAP